MAQYATAMGTGAGFNNSLVFTSAPVLVDQVLNLTGTIKVYVIQRNSFTNQTMSEY